MIMTYGCPSTKSDEHFNDGARQQLKVILSYVKLNAYIFPFNQTRIYYRL